jgi:hypothetical protein
LVKSSSKKLVKSSSKGSVKPSSEKSDNSSEGDSNDSSSEESDNSSSEESGDEAKNEIIGVLGGIFSTVKPQLQDIVTNMEAKPPDGVHYGKQVHDRIRDLKKGINDFEKIVAK